MREGSPDLYWDLADWWPLLSDPADYEDEAEAFHRVLEENARVPIRTVLELGAGGGNNASHLKKYYRLALVDLSPGMLRVSRALNPECEHIAGDIRTLRVRGEISASVAPRAFGGLRGLPREGRPVDGPIGQRCARSSKDRGGVNPTRVHRPRRGRTLVPPGYAVSPHTSVYS